MAGDQRHGQYHSCIECANWADFAIRISSGGSRGAQAIKDTDSAHHPGADEAGADNLEAMHGLVPLLSFWESQLHRQTQLPCADDNRYAVTGFHVLAMRSASRLD